MTGTDTQVSKEGLIAGAVRREATLVFSYSTDRNQRKVTRKRHASQEVLSQTAGGVTSAVCTVTSGKATELKPHRTKISRSPT